jgi:AraC-like DNA-binding protein
LWWPAVERSTSYKALPHVCVILWCCLQSCAKSVHGLSRKRWRLYQRPISGSSDISCWTAGGVVGFAAVGHGRQDAPISEIAYVCGFRDYTHFARKFRHRFGHSPGAAAQDTLASLTQ